jgi:chorismate synthase
MIRFLTAGESHGPQLTAIVEGLPAGVPVDVAAINRDLARRQKGYGRGGRMAIEKDEVRIVSGVRFGLTMGSPITLIVENRDYRNWEKRMSLNPEDREQAAPVTRPRPGHADLAGALKYHLDDIRNVLERASARETTARVAVGSLVKQLLAPLGIRVLGYVAAIGANEARPVPEFDYERAAQQSETSAVRVLDPEVEPRIIAEIDECKKTGDTLGGIVEVVATGLPVGLGSHVQWDRKLDGRLAQALLSVQAAKAVEIGRGFAAARLRGSALHDEIAYDRPNRRFLRHSNNSGGTEGGMTTGEPLMLRVAFKPLSTLMRPLRSVDLRTKEEALGTIERSDVCAVPAAAVICEAVVAFELARAVVEKFGADSQHELKRNYEGYLAQVRDF